MWYKFLLNPEKIEEKEMEENEDVKKAKDEYDKIMEDDANWWRAFAQELYEHDMALAIGDGEDRGFEKGKKEGLLSAAKNLLKIGMNIEEIMQVTELSREEIESLQKA